MFVLWEKVCCHLRGFVKVKSVDNFCMTETWIYDDDSAIIFALTPESHILYFASRPDKKGGEVGCLINKALQTKKQPAKK